MGDLFWTDRDTPRPDGYRWTRDDVVADGIHLSESARVRVAGELLAFFSGDPFADVVRQAPRRTAPTASVEEPAWIVNGKDKRPKLSACSGAIRLRCALSCVISRANGWPRSRISFTRGSTSTCWSARGDYKIEFLDREGKPIKLSQEVGEVLKLK